MSLSEREQLASVPVSERVLLLPHCLRQSNTCRAKYDKQGLQCVACNPECSVNRLRGAALSLGYKGVCVAPGGRLAVNYIVETRPQAIVAVACEKELEEGVNNVKGLENSQAPLVVVIPLSKDGCVDTEVDIDAALEMMSLGCPVPLPDAGCLR